MRPFSNSRQRERAEEQRQRFADARPVVKERDNEQCVICGRHGSGGQVHHRHPRAAGGTSRPEAHFPSNLLYLCGRCHSAVENEGRVEGWSYELGYVLRQEHGVTAEDVPVWAHHERAWYILLDSGVRVVRAGMPYPHRGVLTALAPLLPGRVPRRV